MAETAQAVEEKKEQAQDGQQDSKVKAQSVELSEAEQTDNNSGSSIDILLDMNVNIVVTVGETQMAVKDLLQLGPGSVIKLDKPIDMPADLYLKDTKFATGNIVVVEGRFAVKIKSIIGLENNPAPAVSEG